MLVHAVDGSDLFDQEDLDLIKKKLNPDEIWYEYNIGFYDGSGALLVRKDTKFTLFDIGHCSCYGPLDCLDHAHKGWREFEKIWDSLTDTCKECVGRVFKLARRT